MLAPYRGSPPPRAPTLLGSSLGTRERSCHTLNEPNTVLVSAKRSTTSSEVQSGRKAEIALIHSIEATEIALSPLRKAEGSEVSETEKGETFLRHSAKREQGQCHGERAHSPSTPCMNLPEKGMQVQPPPQIRWCWIWLLGSSNSSCPHSVPKQKGFTGPRDAPRQGSVVRPAHPASLPGAHQHLAMCHARNFAMASGCRCIAYCQLR